MIIVKMNNSAVECSIAASELREIGLTPEAIVNDDSRTATFMAQINKEMEEQLQFDSNSEVLIMTKAMQQDGSLRIFAVKMNNDDIRDAADRITHTAHGLLELATPENISSITGKQGEEKGQALHEMVAKAGALLNNLYLQNNNDATSAKIETVSKPAISYARYMVEFETLSRAVRFCKVVAGLPIVDSSLYKRNGRFYLMTGLETDRDNIVYEMRRCGVEYADGLSVNSPEEFHVTENADCVIPKDAVAHLAVLHN